jgi:hypothetical protein
VEKPRVADELEGRLDERRSLCRPLEESKPGGGGAQPIMTKSATARAPTSVQCNLDGMARILSLVLGLAVIAAAAYWSLTRTSAPRATDDGPSAPKQTLDNVRGAAERIERDAEQRLDEAEQKAFGNE